MAVVTATIKSGTEIMNSGFEILSIDISKEFNKVPIAELKLIDGNVAKKEFNILDGDFFEPGKKIEISLKYEGQPGDGEMLFAGIVVNQGLELNRSGTTLMVELSDESVKMTRLRNNEVFTDKSDSVIIKKLVENHNLTVGNIADTELKHAQMIQYYATDWDFVLSRAEANGQLVLASDGKISTVSPKVDSKAVSLELGLDIIYDFDLQANSLDQIQDTEAMGWDMAKQTLTRPAKGKDYEIAQGNYKIPAIAKSVGGETATLIHAAPLHQDELEAWANAHVIKSRLSFLRGWIKVPGTTQFRVGETIEIKGVSKRFSGKNIITGVRHFVSVTGWVTHIQIGMDANWFSAQSTIVDHQAAGLLPGVNGLQIGVVVAQEKDPNNEFRVKVSIPAFNSQKGMIWARMTSGDAGSKRGVFFRPEVGDEVVVGFLNDDPRQAIILGSMHSSANQPPVPATPENHQKGIVTKQKYQLLFDEKQETITLSTSANNSICIDEKNKQITITSAGDFKITTEGNFEIAAKGNVKIAGKKVDLI